MLCEYDYDDDLEGQEYVTSDSPSARFADASTDYITALARANQIDISNGAELPPLEELVKTQLYALTNECARMPVTLSGADLEQVIMRGYAAQFQLEQAAAEAGITCAMRGYCLDGANSGLMDFILDSSRTTLKVIKELSVFDETDELDRLKLDWINSQIEIVDSMIGPAPLEH